MLTFVGLGLYDLDDISLKGRTAIQEADHIFLDGYTSCLTGTDHAAMEKQYAKPVQLLMREAVEQHPEPILDLAQSSRVVFLTGGDPMVSTTHADLRIRAAQQGIETRIIHGASIVSAVCGLSGLQNYRFGKSCSIPYPAKNWFPKTPFETIAKNLAADLHTIVYLDIQPDRFMTIREAVEIIGTLSEDQGIPIPVYIGIARAGSPDPVVIAGNAEKLKNSDFGGPLHILTIPASLHQIEEEYLHIFAAL
jgi:diphthine synthase